MNRWSVMLACSVVLAGIAAEQSADACPTGAPAGRTARSNRGRPDGRNGRIAPAPAPTPAPASAPAAAEGSAEAYNLARINAFRSAAGLAPLTLDPALSSFARAGTAQLMNDHVYHGHFNSAGSSLFRRGFKGHASENQGSATGWPRMSDDATKNVRAQIDQQLAFFMNEGPNGIHVRNMMAPNAKRVGIGLIQDSSGKLYLTNDFSE